MQFQNPSSQSISPTGGSTFFESFVGVYAVLLGVYFFISPFYFFHSGLPQPADILLALIMVPALAIIFLNQKLGISGPYLAGTMFVLLTIIVNLVHWSFFPVPRFLFSSVYYIYNFMTFIFISYLFKHYSRQLIPLAYIGIAAIILIQIPHIKLFPDTTWRQTGTFNNPNQLAYWSLLSFLMILILRQGSKLKLIDFGLFAILLYLQTQALSKAGMITFALAFCILPFLPQMSKVGRVVMLMTLCAGFIYGLINIEKVMTLPDRIDEIERVVVRLETIGEDEDDNPLVRGYGRLFEFPQYVLVGAGEGAYWRWSPNHPNEIHSGLATIIFSYGITGTAFFLIFLLSVLYRQPWYYVALFGCVFLYSLPHQNIRFTHFWVYLGLLEASRHFGQQKAKETVQKIGPKILQNQSMRKILNKDPKHVA